MTKVTVTTNVVVRNVTSAPTNVSAVATPPAPAAPAVVENPPKAAAKPVKPKAPTRPARITSETVTYDRKEGIAVFDENVYVDDEQYQLHADKVYVFTTDTNDLRRIVAIGHVAMTNEAKRAYGVKASYHRQNGMVVLYGDETCPARVCETTAKGEQTVVGERIRFWIDQEQVEVLKAQISAPAGDFKPADLKPRQK